MKVYIAGPYSQGDTVLNVRTAILAADAVWSAGHIPYLPHLTMFFHLVCPHDYGDWLRLDIAWLECCDCVLRLPGVSSGADQEVRHGQALGKPIWNGLEEFLLHAPQGNGS